MPEKLSFELQREQVLANPALKAIYLHFKDCILFNWVVLFISNDLNHVDLYERICDSYKTTLCSVFTRLPYLQESALWKAQFCRYCSRSVKIYSFRFCFFLVLGFWLNHLKITAFADLTYFFWNILFKCHMN